MMRMKVVFFLGMLFLITSCVAPAHKGHKKQTIHPQKAAKTEEQILDDVLRQKVHISKRLLATIQAEQRISNARPGSALWLEKQLYGNPYTRGRQELTQQLKTLTIAYENIQELRRHRQRIQTPRSGKHLYNGTKCFNVKPYYRKDGTYVRGHTRCR